MSNLMKLYDFVDWNTRNRNIRLTEFENDEVLFKEEFSKIEKGWTVIDVGARVGYYTIKGGLLVGDRGKVLAIEPHPQTYSVLKMNIELWGLKNVVPICKALGSKRGIVKLYEGADSGATSVGSPSSLFNVRARIDRNRLLRWLEFVKRGKFSELVRKSRVQIRHVPMDTLDQLTKEEKIVKVNLVKVDVEGAESDVLKGSERILNRDKPVLLVEIHARARRWGWKPENLYVSLKNLGYNLKIQNQHNKTMLVARSGK